ncbi:hypothetical protein CW304_17000 [Bacillus sp. UFRGS-B20]|nr:hypothetical protein CW304_17000 [Bacillus sp. UFRGS-B20]
MKCPSSVLPFPPQFLPTLWFLLFLAAVLITGLHLMAKEYYVLRYSSITSIFCHKTYSARFANSSD